VTEAELEAGRATPRALPTSGTVVVAAADELTDAAQRELLRRVDMMVIYENRLDAVVRLHTPGYHDSLNLSHAVGAVLALLTAATSTSVTPPPLSTRARERLIDDWNTQLSDRGSFKSSTAARDNPTSLRVPPP
jgi:hypothetical protein